MGPNGEGMCAHCARPDKICRVPGGSHPDVCCTELYQNALASADQEYARDDIYKFAHQASLQERAGYDVSPNGKKPIKPRILEIIEFSKRMGYQRLGLAFCTGLSREAGTVAKIFKAHGLGVVSVICKVGGIDKSRIGVDGEYKLAPGGHESMCNPIGQALVLNEAKTDFNVILGLCVGHDSLFMKYSDALCTTLAVKDRVTGHNPLAAVYISEGSYCAYLNNPAKCDE